MDDKIQKWMYELIYGITECILDDEMHLLMTECKNRWRNVLWMTECNYV